MRSATWLESRPAGFPGASTTGVVFRDDSTFFTVVHTIAGPGIVAND
jgi:hypothetical protein